MYSMEQIMAELENIDKKAFPMLKLEFKGLSELSEYFRTHPQVVGRNASEGGYNLAYWTDGLSFAETMQILNSGGYWEKGKQYVQDKVFEYEQAIKLGGGPSVEHNVAGFTPDVPEFLAGSPVPMLNNEDSGLNIAARPIVRIGVDTSLLAGVHSEQVLNRGAAILTLIDFLETRQQRCELWALNRVRCASDGVDMYFDTLIKPCHLPWDPGCVAFALAHPAWDRRIGFRMMETRPELPRTASGGMGSLIKTVQDIEDWDIYFGGLASFMEPSFAGEGRDWAGNYKTTQGAIEYIQKVASGVLSGELE